MECSGGLRIEFRWTADCDGGKGLIGEILSGTLSDIGRRLVLLPTRRMVQQAKLRIAMEGGGFTGPIMTPGDLPRYIYDILKGSKPVIDVPSREMMIGSIMREMELFSLVRGRDVRPGMVRSVSLTIGELISECVPPGTVKKAAKSKRSMELAGIYDRYMDGLQNLGVIDQDMLAEGAASLLEVTDLKLDSMGIYLPGRLPRSLLELISLLARRSGMVLIMEHNSRKPPIIPGMEKIPTRPAMNVKVPLPGEKNLSRLVMERPVTGICGMDPMEETRSIFRDIKRRCLEERVPPSSISIVLPSKRSRDDIIRAVAEEYRVPVDQGEDLPLEEVPVITAIMRLLDLPASGFRRRDVVEVLSSPFIMLSEEGRERLTGSQLEMLTRTAGMGPTRRSPEEGWSKPLLELGNDATTPDMVREMAVRFRTPLVGLLKRLEKASKERQTVKGHLDALSGLISYLEMSDRLSAVAEEGEKAVGAMRGEGPFQVNVVAFRTFLSSLRSLYRRSRVLSSGKMTFGEFLDLLRIEVSRSRVRSAPRSAGVQIMGLEEAAGLRLGIAYFGDLVEGSLPSVESSFRLLSDTERLDAGLPDRMVRRKELELLAMTLGSTDEPVICVHRSEGDRPVLPSSFVEDISMDWTDTGNDPRSMVELHRKIGELNSPSSGVVRGEFLTLPELMMNTGEEQERVRRGVRSNRKRRQTDANEHSGRIMDDGLLVMIKEKFGPNHVWSVTQFETFRKCPYQFLVRYIFGIEELDDLEPGIPPEKRGIIFHEAVERFYDRFRVKYDRRVTEKNIDEARKMMRSITMEVMDSYPNKGPYWDALREQLLGTEGEMGLMDCFLEVEAQYQGNFLVEGTEIKFGLPDGTHPAVTISLPGAGEGSDDLLLRGSIDRMDVLTTRDGELGFIWDYKTGAFKVDQGSVQVHLYLAALRKLFPERYPGGGGYYYVRRRGSIERVPVIGEDIWMGVVLDREGLQAHINELGTEVQSTIERCLGMIDSIRCGDLSAMSNCKEDWCPFGHLCRKGDA
ncbi:MAG: PD-(D/E)XK nuclease family protein [Candidatus Thermoplasmatota archaeon]|nr:PD-(D/E)XK nuclease family protein [Candidatus Thermoplasmatota archaeon]